MIDMIDMIDMNKKSRPTMKKFTTKICIWHHRLSLRLVSVWQTLTFFTPNFRLLSPFPQLPAKTYQGSPDQGIEMNLATGRPPKHRVVSR